MKAEPLVSIIIPSYKHDDMLKTCIASLKKATDYSNYKIIIVDDSGNNERNLRHLIKEKGIRIVKNRKNLGFAAAVNNGIRAADRHTAYYFIGNDDFVFFQREWLSRLVYSSVDIIGSTLVLEDRKTIEGIGGVVKPWKIGSRRSDERLDYITGLIKKRVFDKIGLFDERFYPGGFEDADLCLRAKRAGFNIALSSDSHIIHLGGKSRHAMKNGLNTELSRTWFLHKNFPASWTVLYELYNLPKIVYRRQLLNHFKGWKSTLKGGKSVLKAYTVLPNPK